jgi:hypothetical protein
MSSAAYTDANIGHHDLHITWCSPSIAETKRVSPVEQELPTLSEQNLSLPLF